MDFSNVNSVALRMVARTLRKQGKLSGHTPESVACVAAAKSCEGYRAEVGQYISGRQIAVLDGRAYASVIDAAIHAGRVDEATVNGVIRWATAKAADTAACASCGHSPSSHDGNCGQPECDCPEYTADEAKPEPMEVEIVTEETEAKPLVNGEAQAALIAGLQGMMRGLVPQAPAIDENAVKAIVAKAIGEAGALRIEIVTPSAATVQVKGRAHAKFPSLVKMINANVSPMLVGPAGSGKTVACRMAADCVIRADGGTGVTFYTQSVCSQTSASTLLGYMDASGTYRPSMFRRAYETGGLYLLDEVDNGNPNVLAVLNAALGNGHCAFPDVESPHGGMVARHPDFRACAAANTWGNGRTVEYVGRNPIDAATLDRFAQVAWNYDEKLERDTSGNLEWACYVQKWRAAIASRGSVKHLVTPRASIHGARLLAVGLPVAEVIEVTITRGLDKSTASAIASEVGEYRG